MVRNKNVQGLIECCTISRRNDWAGRSYAVQQSKHPATKNRRVHFVIRAMSQLRFELLVSLGELKIYYPSSIKRMPYLTRVVGMFRFGDRVGRMMLWMFR